MNLQILYRGPLSSCNYGCVYCPFAKNKSTRAELAEDRAALTRFVGWVEAQDTHQLGVLITPWGEALIRAWYQEAMVRLSHMPHVSRIAIQTNLSARLGWVSDADLDTLAFWATWHPEWTPMERFVDTCNALHDQGVRLSVGVVGFPRFRAAIEALRAALSPEIYLWINAVKRELHTLTEADWRAFLAVDPLYGVNTHVYPSQGRACGAGERVFSVDGSGTMRRCHFIQAPIGNIYDASWEQALRPRACSNASCRCHIGYVHMDELGLRHVFGEGLLERIPEGLRHEGGAAWGWLAREGAAVG